MTRWAPWLFVCVGCANDLRLGASANEPPFTSILAPRDGQTFTSVDSVQLLGTVADANGLDDVASAIWSSSLDGPLGDPAATAPDEGGISVLFTTLSVGTHTVTLTA